MTQFLGTGDEAPLSTPRTVNLGRGVIVPYPEPSSSAATRIGRANRRTDTRPEVALRAKVHHRGLRFRKDLLLRSGGLRVRPDIVFTRHRIAVFVDGCFWHACPLHGSLPKTNRTYWQPKLAGNIDRDRRVDQALEADGWLVVRAWEHEHAADVADRLVTIIAARRQPPTPEKNDGRHLHHQ
ncbi:MAG: very short patch repair endonuclease [Ilumatobacteraceae bacterium]